MFILEPLHYLHLGISKFLKSGFVNYMSAGSLLTKQGLLVCLRKPFSAHKMDMLRGFNVLLVSMKEHFQIARLRVDYLKIRGNFST